MTIYCRGIRGATTVSENTRAAILEATQELLQELVEANAIALEDIGSVIFTTSPDVNADFPALGARQIGWGDVPLLCTHEMSVPGSLPQCIRVLIHWNTPRQQHEIVHVYLRGATKLRPEHSRPSKQQIQSPTNAEGAQ